MNLPVGVTQDAAIQYMSTKVDPNLAHILQKAGVPIALQYLLCQEFTTVRKLSTYEDDRSKALKTDFSVDAAADLPSRAAVAAVVSAWEASTHFATREQELRAEARVLGVSRPVTQTDRAAMKAALRILLNPLMPILLQKSRSWSPKSLLHHPCLR